MVQIQKACHYYTDFKAVCEKVSGSSKINPNIPALTYGRAMEGEAVSTFMELYAQTHKNATVIDCGLFLSKELSFVGGSPDRILSCDCCGNFCLEIKCPASISHTSPWDPDVNLPFLKRENDLLVLNRNHKYYTQCQVQMAVTGIHQSYFIVWTARGMSLERLNFDSEFWSALKNLFRPFYEIVYVPFILNSNLKASEM